MATDARALADGRRRGVGAMRESASLASLKQQQKLPAGLMQRLEMMKHLALQVKAQTESKIQDQIPRASADASGSAPALISGSG